MQKLTREFYEEYAKRHRMLWRWVSDNPTKRKKDHPDWLVVNSLPHQCFACEIKNMQIGKFPPVHSAINCRKHCPIIEFRCGNNNCADSDSCLYSEYENYRHIHRLNVENKHEKAAQKYLKKVARTAYLIAELPWFDYDYYVLLDNCFVYDFDIERAKQHRVVEFRY